MYDKKRMALSLFWVVLGVALIALSIAEVLDSSLYAGMGGALMTVGALQLVRFFRYRKDPAYREALDTKINDERESFLRMKSWSWTGYLVLLLEGVGAIVAMICGERTIQLLLTYCVCLILGLYWTIYLILKRKY